jgi:hypothetical protein
VIGQVVFQNSMSAKTPQLVGVLNPEQAMQLSGGNAGANTRVINALPPGPRDVVRVAFANSLQPMWGMYTAFSFVGLCAGFLIVKKTLSSQHQETKTGLAAEEENAAARTAEKQAKRASKMASRSGTPRTSQHFGSGDTLAGNDGEAPPMPEGGRAKDLEMGHGEKGTKA